MSEQRFVRSVRVPVPAAALFRWHEQPGAFERLLPPWEDAYVERRTGSIRDGDRLVLRTRVGPMWLRWIAEHRDFRAGEAFTDVQVAGPFARWVHVHRIQGVGPREAELCDEVTWALPLGVFGQLAGGRLVRRTLERMFRYRHRITHDDLQAHAGTRPMKIAVTGSTGLVGQALVPFLTSGGHTVARLVRGSAAGADIGWNPDQGTLDPKSMAGLDAVVHLAGENIAGRWTAAKKAAIRHSRVAGTRLLAERLAACPTPPRVLVCASAIGIYGDRGDEVVDEQSRTANDYLAEVCAAWEAAAEPARQKGIRVVHLRLGIVLSPRGGALKKMLLPFQLGGGGPVGSGRQFMSWIALDDVVGAIHHALTHETLRGPVNVVAPAPVTSRDFARTLGRVLRRPAFLPMPAFAVRLLFGEMGEALLLHGQRVQPAQLLASGYRFRCAELEGALRHVLGR